MNLKEHKSQDVMDVMIMECVYDVTSLEFAVAMHTKRGESIARRRKALAGIGALEINTNNNAEILREAAGKKKSHFLRILCRNFL